MFGLVLLVDTFPTLLQLCLAQIGHGSCVEPHGDRPSILEQQLPDKTGGHWLTCSPSNKWRVQISSDVVGNSTEICRKRFVDNSCGGPFPGAPCCICSCQGDVCKSPTMKSSQQKQTPLGLVDCQHHWSLACWAAREWQTVHMVLAVRSLFRKLENRDRKTVTARDVTGFYAFSPPGNRAIFSTCWGYPFNNYIEKLEKNEKIHWRNSRKIPVEENPLKSQISVASRYTRSPEKKEKSTGENPGKIQWSWCPEIADFRPLSWSNASWEKATAVFASFGSGLETQGVSFHSRNL